MDVSVLALALSLAAQDVEHFPLKAGTTWSYRMSSGQSLEVKVLGPSAVGAQACVVVENVLGPQTTREHVAVTREGLTAFKVENASGAMDYPTPIVRARIPFKKGDTWRIEMKEGLQVNVYTFVTEGLEKVVVPAGAVEAWKVVATLKLPQGGQAVMSSWYAAGLGLVKQVYELNGATMTTDLVSTSLKPSDLKPAEPAPGPRTCAKCGTVDKAGGKFCAECATPFPPR